MARDVHPVLGRAAASTARRGGRPGTAARRWTRSSRVGTTAAWAYSVFVTLWPEVVHEAGLHPETYFDSVGDHPRPRPARPVARGPGQGPHDRRHPAPRRPPGDDRPTARATASRRTSQLDDRRAGRPAPRPARRQGPGRRRLVEGSSAVDESMLTGEPIPVDEAARRRGHRRDAQHDGLVRHARDAGRARHGARPDRRAGPARAGLEGADPAPRRPDRRGLRPGRPRRRGGDLRRLVRCSARSRGSRSRSRRSSAS